MITEDETKIVYQSHLWKIRSLDHDKLNPYLIKQNTIGRVLHIEGFGPHRLGGPRPAWFYEKARYGGILCDIGSHQLEQFLYFAGVENVDITFARKANYAHPATPEFEDFGECTATAANGVSGYFRVDWFTPDGLRNWGDGRTFITGTDGYIELRKFIDLAVGEKRENMVYWANRQGEFSTNATGKVGCPFFGRLIRDCIDRTETAMTQAHAFTLGQKSACRPYRRTARPGHLPRRRRFGSFPVHRSGFLSSRHCKTGSICRLSHSTRAPRSNPRPSGRYPCRWLCRIAASAPNHRTHG